MSSDQKTVSVFLALLSELLVLILGLVLDWPVWVLASAVGVVLLTWTMAMIAAKRARARVPFPPETIPLQPCPPVERRELYVERIALPSAERDYDFLFSATVRWCPADPSARNPVINPGALAVDAILARAREVTATRKPFRSSLVQHELSGRLGVMETDREGHVRAMALDVTLALSEEDQTRLDRLAAIRKDEAVWEHQRNYEKNKRRYLGDDVLQNTGSAVVWWLAKNDDQVEKTVEDIGLLAQLSSAANNEEVAEPFRHLVDEALPEAPVAEPEPAETASADPADVFTDFMCRVGLAPGNEEGVMLAGQVAMAVSSWDADTAAEIRRRFIDRATMAHPNGGGPGHPAPDA
ncbi:hypothetical protein G5C60_27870 [Streptomyces sp. HC44]|uniref:Uncharacterized protein n=1 Tax=Streptomyces scabichelini TaxID=2711217 RepID=A0A6G4VB11_9ACTN|nr:hypothetical protein [Streptomyces scabichelini]NGO11318.1 hypothetical protein [Streptomyces scabichelini]